MSYTFDGGPNKAKEKIGRKTKDPMSPEKIMEHEPTAVKRKMTEKITEAGKEAGSTTPKEALERARRSGMTKGTASSAER